MASPEAIERKRARNREYERRRPPRQRPDKRRRSVEIWAEDESWLTLTCSRCFRLFDVPRKNVRLRELCEECRS